MTKLKASKYRRRNAPAFGCFASPVSAVEDVIFHKLIIYAKGKIPLRAPALTLKRCQEVREAKLLEALLKDCRRIDGHFVSFSDALGRSGADEDRQAVA